MTRTSAVLHRSCSGLFDETLLFNGNTSQLLKVKIHITRILACVCEIVAYVSDYAVSQLSMWRFFSCMVVNGLL